MLSRVGAKMDPRVTQHIIGVRSDLYGPIDTKESLSFRYDLNQLWAVPECPAEFYSLSSYILWLTISNAALRSSSTEIETLPLSGVGENRLSAVMWLKTRLERI